MRVSQLFIFLCTLFIFGGMVASAVFSVGSTEMEQISEKEVVIEKFGISGKGEEPGYLVSYVEKDELKTHYAKERETTIKIVTDGKKATFKELKPKSLIYGLYGNLFVINENVIEIDKKFLEK